MAMRPRRRLMWRYAAVVVTLVGIAIVSVGVSEFYFSYEDSKRAITNVEADKASTAAISIGQFIEEILADLRRDATGAGLSSTERHQAFQRLLNQNKAISALTYLDASGRACVRAYVREANKLDTLARQLEAGTCEEAPDYPAEFAGARARAQYFGPIFYNDWDSRPHLTVALPESPRTPAAVAAGGGVDGEDTSGGVGSNASGGVVVADVDLGSVVDAIKRAQIGTAGYAYAVDAKGELIAHSAEGGQGKNLVLAHTSFTGLPQVDAALAAGGSPSGVVSNGRDQDATEVLSAYQTVDPPGWRVFVEEPTSEAFAPIQDAIWRTAVLLIAFLVLAVLVSVLLARNLVRPIERIQAAAANIGSGALDQRIEVSSSDELGALADEFNRMAARLRDYYADLEHDVAERTRELASALAALDEKSGELEAASRHKSEFLANMSHELRTPLNAISGFSQVLRKQLFGEINDKQAEYLDDILASSRHLLSLIDDVLDLAKVEAGQIELRVTPFSLPEALEGGVMIVRERAARSDLSISLAADGVGTVIGDERRVRQVVYNLLSNAVKFTPPGGSIDVRAVRVDGEIRVSVRDTGPGIASQDLARIFEEFQQAELGRTQHDGTGLGLALSRRLIELHGGRIWVDSEPGGGSTFTFTLPHTPA